ncbi:ribosome-recycling factor, mitochondrial isoform X1 [Heliangelus exortis]|uniref:ribosome-recycling factor, mitochondrial isoform X1 n=1 Tax=Heliangelus exortis TaxID=472823 RepID=UPI003A9535CF
MAMALRCFRHLPPLLYSSSSAALRGLPQLPAGCPDPLRFGCQRGVHQVLLSRQFATKKAKGKGQSQAKVNIKAALVEDIINLEETSEDMQAVVEALKEDFSRNLSVRTSPGALDHIVVMTKEGKFPLNQLGQISQKSPQLLVVNMTSFPESTAAAMKAIRESGMNLNPEVDGTIIRVPVPKCFSSRKKIKSEHFNLTFKHCSANYKTSKIQSKSLRAVLGTFHPRLGTCLTGLCCPGCTTQKWLLHSVGSKQDKNTPSCPFAHGM